MFCKLTEVVEEIEFGHTATGTKTFHTRDIVVNNNYIIHMREDDYVTGLTKTDSARTGKLQAKSFTRLTVSRGGSAQELIVAGSLEEVEQQVLASKFLLKG